MNRLNLPDWDGDRCGEESQVFLNLGNDEYRNFLCDSISTTIERFQIDAVFLDTMSWQPNDAQYCMWRGVQDLMNTLRKRFPQVLWASEGTHARLIKFFPLVQIRLLPKEELLYPEFAYRYIRTFDHLDTGSPGLGSSGVHERGFHGYHFPTFRPNHIPALGIVKDTLKRHSDEIQKICEAVCRDGIHDR
jgi:hypothetical protein